MNATGRRVGIALTGIALAGLLAACGVPVDDQPQQIDVPALDSLAALHGNGLKARS